MRDSVRASQSDARSTWEGQLCLQFDRQADRTRLARSYQQAPLMVQRPYYPEGPRVCHAVTLHNAGGIVGGDRLNLDIAVGAGGHAAVTSASAGKIYGSNGQEARQHTRLTVGPEACLEWLPQESIVFEGACWRQDLVVELAAGARFVGWEVVRFGRTARGEGFFSGRWRATTEVWQAGKPLWIDRQQLSGSHASWQSAQGLAGEPVVGCLAVLGQGITGAEVEALRALWRGRGEVGVTRLPAGLLCRYRGSSSAEAFGWFLEAWRLLRPRSGERGLGRPAGWLSCEDLIN